LWAGSYIPRNLVFLVFQVVTVFLVAVAMSMALAHALEMSGQRRLDEQTYVAVQIIYYPGFTIAGIGEVLAIVATLVLMLITPKSSGSFWWIAAGFVGIATMHAVFWVVTQPVKRYWMKNEQLGRTGQKFFSTGSTTQEKIESKGNWVALRNRWEYFHVARAIPGLIWLLAEQHSRLSSLAKLLVPYRADTTIERSVRVTQEVLRATSELARARGATPLLVVLHFGHEEQPEQMLRRRILDNANIPYVFVDIDSSWRLAYVLCTKVVAPRLTAPWRASSRFAILCNSE
jgi:hypothetical protein